MDREVHGRIHRQMQATAIPKGQNWPQIKMIRKKNGWSKMFCVHQFESKYRGNTAVSLIRYHYDDVIMSTKASQITSLTIVYSTIYSGTDQSKHQSSASLAFVWGIHRGLVNSPHKWPVTRKMFPFDDVIMSGHQHASSLMFCSHCDSPTWLSPGASIAQISSTSIECVAWISNHRHKVSCWMSLLIHALTSMAA